MAGASGLGGKDQQRQPFEREGVMAGEVTQIRPDADQQRVELGRGRARPPAASACRSAWALAA